jgi:hypothetical protein
MSESIYQRHMGDAYARLAKEVQDFHALQGSYRLLGEVNVTGAETIWGKLLSFVMRFPASSHKQPFEFKLRTESNREIWQRRFPTRTMASAMSLKGGFLVESFGPMQCRFVLHEQDGHLVMEPRGIRYCGIPMPTFLLPQITASEHGGEGKLFFDVSARWPGRYLTVAYRGWLDVDGVETLQ